MYGTCVAYEYSIIGKSVICVILLDYTVSYDKKNSFLDKSKRETMLHNDCMSNSIYSSNDSERKLENWTCIGFFCKVAFLCQNRNYSDARKRELTTLEIWSGTYLSVLEKSVSVVMKLSRKYLYRIPRSNCSRWVFGIKANTVLLYPITRTWVSVWMFRDFILKSLKESYNIIVEIVRSL